MEVPFTSTLPIISVEIESQGCADAGLCYPPRKELLTVDTTSGITTLSEPAKKSPATSESSQPSFSLGLILIFALLNGIKSTSKINDAFLGNGYFLKYISQHFNNTLVLATEISKVYCDELAYIMYPEVIDAVETYLKTELIKHAEAFYKAHKL